MNRFLEAVKRHYAPVLQGGMLILQAVILWQLLAVREIADDASSSAYQAMQSASFAAQDAEHVRNKLNGF